MSVFSNKCENNMSSTRVTRFPQIKTGFVRYDNICKIGGTISDSLEREFSGNSKDMCVG